MSLNKSNFFTFSIYICLFTYWNPITAQECRLDLQKDIPNQNQPIFLNKNNQLAIPVFNQGHGVLTFKKGDEVTIACTGNRNGAKDFEDESSLKGQCSNNGLQVDGNIVTPEDFTCDQLSDSYIQGTGTKCGNGSKAGEIFDIGFKVISGFVKLFSVCHDVKAATTLYAQHNVYNSIGGAQQESKRPQFRVGDKTMFKGLPPKKAYNQNNQKSVFETALGSKTEADQIINKSSFLARGHLAPDGDFLFAAWQYATYYYANVCPQFQSINAGNWLRFESAVRDLAKTMDKTLSVTTGTYGILTMKDKPIYLDPRNQGIPVPETFFKIVIEPESSRGIGLVCSNNPSLQQAPKLLCKQDICAANKWPVMQDDFRKGYCYCCDVQELSSTVAFLPQMKTKSVLPFK
uniref:Uncharacterized protein n=1 Tax=Cacopsylla melanoneura TaxID=428564 RepID=A0A8D8V9W2_9HEMI